MISSQPKKLLLAALAALVVGGVAYADGEWIRTGPVWFKNLVYTGSSRVALTNAAGNLSTTTGAFSGAVSVSGITNTGSITTSGNSNVTGALAVTGTATIRDAATLADEVLFSDVTAAATASVGSVQGSGPLTVTAIQATVIATAGDNFTLPVGIVGMVEFVCNADASGTDAMDLFPASGGQINKEAADAAISLAHGECAFCIAFTTLRWGCVIGSAT